MMKKCLCVILLLACVNALNAVNFSEKSTLWLGAYGNFGAAIGEKPFYYEIQGGIGHEFITRVNAEFRYAVFVKTAHKDGVSRKSCQAI